MSRWGGGVRGLEAGTVTSDTGNWGSPGGWVEPVETAVGSSSEWGQPHLPRCGPEAGSGDRGTRTSSLSRPEADRLSVSAAPLPGVILDLPLPPVSGRRPLPRSWWLFL